LTEKVRRTGPCSRAAARLALLRVDEGHEAPAEALGRAVDEPARARGPRARSARARRRAPRDALALELELVRAVVAAVAVGLARDDLALVGRAVAEPEAADAHGRVDRRLALVELDGAVRVLFRDRAVAEDAVADVLAVEGRAVLEDVGPVALAPALDEGAAVGRARVVLQDAEAVGLAGGEVALVGAAFWHVEAPVALGAVADGAAAGRRREVGRRRGDGGGDEEQPEPLDGRHRIETSRPSCPQFAMFLPLSTSRAT